MTTTPPDVSLFEAHAELTTRSGLRLTLRPVDPADTDRVRELYHGLSPEDLRFRFLSAKRHLASTDLSRLIEVDHRSHEHLLAFDPQGALVGSLMLAADPAMEQAEVAIAVAAPAKGRGIGWTLLRHAADLARERGFRKLTAIESRDSHEALEVERDLGFTAKAMPGDPTLVLVETGLH